VAGRPRQAPYRDALQAVIAKIEQMAVIVEPASTVYGLGDPYDEVYLATAEVGDAVLITGNTRDFTEPQYGTAEVLTPRAFLDRTARAARAGSATRSASTRWAAPKPRGGSPLHEGLPETHSANAPHCRRPTTLPESVNLGWLHARKRRPGMNRRLTAIVERDGDGYVALCPEMDVVSQGDSVTEARSNLEEALTLFFETASPEEIERRTRTEFYVTHVEVAVG